MLVIIMKEKKNAIAHKDYNDPLVLFGALVLLFGKSLFVLHRRNNNIGIA